MALILTATQQCDVKIEVFDAKGNPATIDGRPEWASSEEAYVVVEPDDDGLTALIKAVGPATDTPVQINVTVDADLGEGVRELVGILEVTVIAGEATVVNISAGSPEEQEEA